MSGFSDVDASGTADSLAAYLRSADVGLAAMKSYMAFAAHRAVASQRVVDIGCGLGQDLDRLSALGMVPLGIEPSAEMLERARSERGVTSRLVRADGAQLPLASRSIDGCRIERVLQHVDEPESVLAEVSRVLRSDGFLAVFEPDYTTFRVDSEVIPDGAVPARLLRVRHPDIGHRLGELIERHDFEIDDVVTESSRGYSLSRLPIDASAVLHRAVTDGRAAFDVVEAWLDEQRKRTEDGTFRARWDKVLVVARRR